MIYKRTLTYCTLPLLIYVLPVQCALIDVGATPLCVSFALVKRLGLYIEAKPYNEKIRGVGGIVSVLDTLASPLKSVNNAFIKHALM